MGLMRVVPLLSSSIPPALWRDHPAVELLLDGGPTIPWIGAVRQGLEVHALHAPDPGWQADPAGLLVPELQVDFLVLPAAVPQTREATTALLAALEFLLETARGPRLALRPLPGSAEGLSRLLREVQAHAVGFCWDPALGADITACEDRVLCAVAAPQADLSPLEARGYRWNVALPAQTPEGFAADRNSLHRQGIDWVVPAVGEPEAPLRWGSAWGQP